MTFHIYRPEITCYTPDAEGVLVSTKGTFTWTFFYPMPDEAMKDHGFCRRTIAHGSEPAFTIIAPDGSFLFEKGRAMFLRTPDQKVHDAENALIFAKTGRFGFDLVRSAAPLPIEPAKPSDLPIPRPAAPDRPKGRTSQLSLFGEEVALA